ncbi:MAG TPA: hypothetical protein VMU53_18510 [Candidatus Sulfotelmatobacter sp.]|nr:hypothetical protein [Candidatus Sulfotelmatobacter sp.]
MQCKELEAVLASEGLSPLPPEAREHLSGCTSCQDLLADLSTIVVAAKRIPAEVAPPDRIWISLRAQLEAEGIIRDVPTGAVALPSPWWQSFAAFFQPRALATAAAALFLLVGSVYVLEHRNTRTAPPPIVQAPPSTQAQTDQTPPPAQSTSKAVSQGSTLSASNTSSNKSSSARHSAPSHPAIAAPDSGLRPSPSENAYLGDSRALLADVQDSLPRNALADNPAVDASLRQNLRTINEFIAECESRLKQNPQDQLTREYLNMAYQQKAELLNAMMDSGRSEH